VLKTSLNFAVMAMVFTGGMVLGQSSISSNSEIPANDLLKKVLENEIKTQTDDHSHWKYQSTTVSATDPKKFKREEIVQTNTGDISHLTMIDGRALTPDEEMKEENRIQSLLNDPEAQRKKQRDAAEDGKRAARYLRIIPQAVLASYGERRGDLQELNFKPNPNFKPSTREDEVLHALAGQIWVNTKEYRLAEISGHLVETVKFGGGLLGYLEQGGQFEVKQKEVGPGHWEIATMHVDMHGKALCFKTINVHQDQDNSNYEPAPNDLTLAQGAQELRQELHASVRMPR
jgi:hypothetical protein